MIFNCDKIYRKYFCSEPKWSCSVLSQARFCLMTQREIWTEVEAEKIATILSSHGCAKASI